MPRGARPLSVEVQPAHDGARVVLWTLVIDGQPTVSRLVALVPTGEEMDRDVVERCEYVGTLQTLVPCRRPDGTVTPRAIVGHVWIERDVTAAN